MDPRQAQEVLTQNVYVPAFIEKCAERGVQFNSEEELIQALETVALLKQSQAQQSGSLIKSAHDDLCAAMGVGTSTPQARPDIVAALSNNQTIKEAVAALNAVPE